MTGAAGDERDSGFAGQPAVGVGHVDGCGFVADVDQIEIGIEGGVEDRHDVIAGQREHAAAAETLERPGDDVGAAQRSRHVCPFKPMCNLAVALRHASLSFGRRIGV